MPQNKFERSLDKQKLHFLPTRSTGFAYKFRRSDGIFGSDVEGF